MQCRHTAPLNKISYCMKEPFFKAVAIRTETAHRPIFAINTGVFLKMIITPGSAMHLRTRQRIQIL